VISESKNRVSSLLGFVWLGVWIWEDRFERIWVDCM